MSILDYFRSRNVPSPLERTLIDRLAASLDPEAATLIRAQVSAVNLVQRHSQNREVCFYHMEGKHVRWPDELRLPAQAPDAHLATLAFRVATEPEIRKVDFHLVRGILFSLVFDKSPSAINQLTTLEITPPVLHMNPLHAGEPTPEGVRAALPRDYPLGAADAQIVPEGWTVYLPTAIRKLVLNDDTWYVLAERLDDGVLAVREGSQDGRIWYVPYDGAPRGLSDSLHQTFEQIARS